MSGLPSYQLASPPIFAESDARKRFGRRPGLWQAGPVLDPWTLGLVAVVVLGLALIAYGALHDRARNRRAREEMLSPPKREIPQFRPDTPAPQYLSELQARRPPADATSTACPTRIAPRSPPASVTPPRSPSTSATPVDRS